MTNSVSDIITKFFIAGAILLSFSIGECYDSPDFEKPAFSRDGIFLTDNQRDSILGALASLASNFPGNTRVDGDLKEKAIAIALTLDPMNFAARKAHAALRENEVPESTPFFDSLSAVSESLWSGAEALLAAPVEPENAKLAAYLIELSLLTHPQPPKERLIAFARATDKKPLPWDQFVSLQTDTNPSTRRVHDIFLNLADVDTSAPIRNRMQSQEPTFFGATTDGNSAREASAPKVDFTPVTKGIYCVLYAEAIDGKPMSGKLILEARPPSGSESVPSGDGLPFLTKQSERIELVGFEKLDSTDNGRSWQWPDGIIGSLDFETEEPTPGPPRRTTVGVMLCSAVLAESAMKKLDINEQIVIAGDLASTSSESMLKGGLIPTIETAAKLQKPYLAVPESEYRGLIDYLVESEQLGILFATELISYRDLAEAVTLMTRPVSDSLSEASRAFSEIEAVSTRMSFVDLARNAKVQERLEGILAEFPRHMSAKAMLEFGQAPVGGMANATENTGGSVTDRIDEAILPFLQLDTGNPDINELRNKLEAAQLAVSRLRTEITLETRDYHALAEDFLDAAELYIGLTNQTTATAQQRLREARQAIAELETERRGLGLGEFE